MKTFTKLFILPLGFFCCAQTYSQEHDVTDTIRSISCVELNIVTPEPVVSFTLLQDRKTGKLFLREDDLEHSFIKPRFWTLNKIKFNDRRNKYIFYVDTTQGEGTFSFDADNCQITTH